jgi:hypothetical protein
LIQTVKNHYAGVVYVIFGEKNRQISHLFSRNGEKEITAREEISQRGPETAKPRGMRLSYLYRPFSFPKKGCSIGEGCSRQREGRVSSFQTAYMHLF